MARIPDRAVRHALPAFLAVAVGCSGLLDVDRPDIIQPGALGGTVEGAQTLYAGAIGDFAVAHDGANSAVEVVGLFTDEFSYPATEIAETAVDRRAVAEDNTMLGTTYLNLHRARESARRAAEALTAVREKLPNPQQIGEMYALEGLSVILLAEMFCSGVPLSTSDETTVTYGDPNTTEQLYQAALQALDLAAQNSAGDPHIGNLIAVLRGRALLGLGDFAEAGAAVTGVPTDFRYEITHSDATVRQQNDVALRMWGEQALFVSDVEGGNGLNFASASDPRVPVSDLKLLTYSESTSPVVAASGVEARLIEAEAALAAGDIPAFTDELNEARAFEGLGPVSDPGSASARVDLLFRERAFALYATAHRLGDLRRLIRYYGRSQEEVFPVGDYKTGLTYGTDVTLTIPQSERNNPKFHGCLDAGA